jgi:hypothetical protein
MSLRFTDTKKWQDPWYFSLPTWGKLLWLYAVDNCDHVGHLSMSEAQMSVYVPGIDWPAVPTLFAGRMVRLSGDSWLLPKFLAFQQPRLFESKNKNMQVSVNRLLEKHGLEFSQGLVGVKGRSPCEGPSKDLPRTFQGPQVEVQVQDKVQVKESAERIPPKPPHFARFEAQYANYDETPEGKASAARRAAIRAERTAKEAQ